MPPYYCSFFSTLSTCQIYKKTRDAANGPASTVSLPKRPDPSDDILFAAIVYIHPIHVIAVMGWVIAIDLPVCYIGSLAHGEEISVLTLNGGRDFVA